MTTARTPPASSSASSEAPVPESFSGKLHVRLPTALHAHLSHTAAEQGVSLNTLIVSLLAGGSGFKLKEEK